jgi:DNA polymerase-3 subunit delta'
MALARLIGNARIREALRRASARDRLPHALLFAGPEGVGKRTTALELARAVTCVTPIDGDACEQCSSCLHASGEHPDIRLWAPEGAFIKIAQMRDLAREANFRPFEGRRRLMVVDDAHRLREEAANAILKTLEEPPPTSLIVLVTDQPYAMLETIRSRCQTMRFAPLEPAEVEQYLAANFKRPTEETRLLARVAGGRIGRAIATDLSVYRERRKEMLGLVEVLGGDVDRLRLMKAAQYLGDVGRKDGAEFEARLELFQVLCRDLYGLALGESPEQVANADIALRLQQLAATLKPARVARWVEAIDRLRGQLRQNVNRQLALEAIFLDLAEREEGGRREEAGGRRFGAETS